VSEQSDDRARQTAIKARREEMLEMLDRRFALVDCAHPAVNLLRREAERHWSIALEDDDE